MSNNLKIKVHESRDVLGTVQSYELISVYKGGVAITDKVWKPRYSSADELYNALDEITGGSTRGNLNYKRGQEESAIEGYLDLTYTDRQADWSFRVWVCLEFTDPVATAKADLGL